MITINSTLIFYLVLCVVVISSLILIYFIIREFQLRYTIIDLKYESQSKCEYSYTRRVYDSDSAIRLFTMANRLSQKAYVNDDLYSERLHIFRNEIKNNLIQVYYNEVSYSDHACYPSYNEGLDSVIVSYVIISKISDNRYNLLEFGLDVCILGKYRKEKYLRYIFEYIVFNHEISGEILHEVRSDDLYKIELLNKCSFVRVDRPTSRNDHSLLYTLEINKLRQRLNV